MRAKLAIYRALGRGVLLETVRRKDLWVVAILGGLIVAVSGTLGFFGLSGLQVFVKDLSFNVLGLLSTILAILISARQLPDEIKNRTLYPLLARPITRFDFLIGKLWGSILASWIAFLMLAITVALGMAMFHISFEWIMLQYLVLKMMGLALVCALSMALSVAMTPSGATTMALVLAFGSPRISQALVMAYPGQGPGMQAFFRVLNWFLPQPGLFDIGSRAANIGWNLAPAWVMGALALYLFAYGGGLVALAWSRFRTRPI